MILFFFPFPCSLPLAWNEWKIRQRPATKRTAKICNRCTEEQWHKGHTRARGREILRLPAPCFGLFVEAIVKTHRSSQLNMQDWLMGRHNQELSVSLPLCSFTHFRPDVCYGRPPFTFLFCFLFYFLFSRCRAFPGTRRLSPFLPFLPVPFYVVACSSPMSLLLLLSLVFFPFPASLASRLALPRRWILRDPKFPFRLISKS